MVINPGGCLLPCKADEVFPHVDTGPVATKKYIVHVFGNLSGKIHGVKLIVGENVKV